MNVCATTELELSGLHGSRPPSVVVSYGLGLDSTCLLLRWLREPSTRDFAVEDMVVVTAMVGDEFSSTTVAVESLMLPLFREFGVRYVQCARGQRVTTAAGEGVVVLDDSTYPQKLYAEGAYRLSDEMLSAGTLPQLGSTEVQHACQRVGFGPGDCQTHGRATISACHWVRIG